MKRLALITIIMVFCLSAFSFSALPAKAVTASVGMWNVAHFNCYRLSGRCELAYWTKNYPGKYRWDVLILREDHWYWGL